MSRSCLVLWIAFASLTLAQPVLGLDLAELARRTLGADQGVHVEAADGTVLVAQAAGGAAAVERLARALVPADQRGEITLGGGAGVDPRNRLSPRVTVRLLRVLEADLARSGHGLHDVLPVAGVDEGTLRHRLDAPQEARRVVGKTGSYGDCALAGAFRSARHGTVSFAILNRGIPILPGRQRQDAFISGLLEALDGEPWPCARDPAPAFTRARLELARVASPSVSP